MSEETTKNFGNEETFEARVLSLLVALRGDVAGLRDRVTVIDGRLTSIEGRVASLELKVGALDEKVGALDQKVDARLHDTRPIWESVSSRLQIIDKKFDIHSHDMLELRAEMELLRQRVPPAA
ncbi:MAG TPA: hypothetical protein VEY09_02345 [Pyrinomonadaceae bacterium]|nr:hypothetical protein [Pyrinomonadaceae bacterium]